jgi:hypothetical protein
VVKRLYIRVEDAPADDPGAGYPVRLWAADAEHPGDHTSGDPAERLLASATIPRNLPWPASLTPDGTLADRLRHILLGAQPPSALQLERLGGHLYQLLTGGGIGEAWRDALRQARPGGARTVLDVQPDNLRRLPWELMTHDDWFPFVDPGNPCVRGASSMGAGHEPELVPLRVLVVVGDSDDPALAAEAEVGAILGSLRAAPGRVHAEVLYGPSRQKLAEKLGQLRPHVVHFVGHGGVSPGTTKPVLFFRPEQPAAPWELRRADVRSGFSWIPRLVVLNACRTAEAAAQQGVWSLAEAFAEQGVGAVVSMQADVVSEAAVQFTMAMYESLWRNEALDVAVAQGRRAVYQAYGFGRRDWCLPTLTLQVPADQVLGVCCGIDKEHVDKLEQTVEFAELAAFVDRSEQRRQLWWAVDPEQFAPPARRSLLVVSGPPRVGKSMLTQACLTTSYLRGRQVAYVDLGGQGTKLWHDVLRMIPRAAGDSPIQRGLEPSAFWRFNYDMNHLARGHSPPEPAEVLGPVADKGVAFAPASERFTDIVKQVFASFRGALELAAGGSPLILALDGLGSVPEDDFVDYLCVHLLEPVARNQVKHLRVVLVLNDVQRSWLPDALRGLAQEITVEEFRREELTRLTREYVLRRGLAFTDWLHEIVKALERHPRQDRWTPPQLLSLVDQLVGLGAGGGAR